MSSYANGIGNFVTIVGIERGFGISFGLMAFTTFVYDTLDVLHATGAFIFFRSSPACRGPPARWLATALTAGRSADLPGCGSPNDAKGRPRVGNFSGTLFGREQSVAGGADRFWGRDRLALANLSCQVGAGLSPASPAFFMYVMSMWAPGSNSLACG